MGIYVGLNVTEDLMWKTLIWSLYWAYEGLEPDRGPDNVLYTAADGELFLRAIQVLAGGHYGIVWVSAADLDWMHKKARSRELHFSISSLLVVWS